MDSVARDQWQQADRGDMAEKGKSRGAGGLSFSIGVQYVSQETGWRGVGRVVERRAGGVGLGWMGTLMTPTPVRNAGRRSYTLDDVTLAPDTAPLTSDLITFR